MQRFLLALSCAFALVASAETKVGLPHGDFEAADEGWSVGDKGMSRIVAEAARGGAFGLRVVDESDAAGSSCRSAAVTVTAGQAYLLRFWGRAVDGVGGVGVYLQFFDAKGKGLNTPDRHNEAIVVVGGEQKDWQEYSLAAKAPEGATTLSVWVHSFNGSLGRADLDDFSLAALSDEEAAALRPVAATKPAGRAFPVLSAERIASIAAWLPEKPAGVGRPASDRAAWDRLAALPEAEGVLKGAAGYLDTPPPEVPDELYLEFTKTGNRRNYEGPYGKRTGRIQALLLAECLEYKGRFLKALERDVMAMCEERSWTMPAHDSGLSNFNGTQLYIDLGSSARGWLLSSVDYWLGDQLAPEVRTRLRQEVQRRVLDPYLAAVRSGDLKGNWWMVGNNNWNAVCTAGVVGTALALVDSPRDRAEFLAAMEVSNPIFVSGFTDDGYCSEGMGYWNYGFGHFIMMDLEVRAATGGNLEIFQGEKLKRIAAYALGYQIQPGKAPWFADGGGAPSGDIWALLRQVYPQAVPVDAQLPDLLRGGHVVVGLRAFGQEPPPPSGETTGLPLRTWFGDAQVLVSRSKPTAPVPFGAGIKGGHNAEQHNHNDVGSYAIVLDGVDMLGDPGGEIYTRRTFSRDRYVSKVLSSYGHPVPVVGGKLQSGGRQAAAKVISTEFSSVRDCLMLDLAAAYPVPEITSLTRRFCYDRRKEIMEIIDEATFSKPQTFSVPLVTYRKVFRRTDDTLFLYDTKHCLQVLVAVEGGMWQVTEEEIENPGRPSPTRLAFSLELPVAAARVRFLIQPCEFPDDLPGIYREPTWGAMQPQVERAVMVEAEAPSGQEGGEVTVCDKPGASGQAIKFWDQEGHGLEYSFDLTQAGTYAVQLRMCATANTPLTRQVLIDGKPLAGIESFLLPDTGGWSSTESDWRDVYLSDKTAPALVDLTPGKHVLKLVNNCGTGVNLDWLKLVPVQE